MTVEQLYEQAKQLHIEHYEIHVSDGWHFHKLKARHIDVIQNPPERGEGVPEGFIRISTV